MCDNSSGHVRHSSKIRGAQDTPGKAKSGEKMPSCLTEWRCTFCLLQACWNCRQDTRLMVLRWMWFARKGRNPVDNFWLLWSNLALSDSKAKTCLHKPPSTWTLVISAKTEVTGNAWLMITIFTLLDTRPMCFDNVRTNGNLPNYFKEIRLQQQIKSFLGAW